MNHLSTLYILFTLLHSSLLVQVTPSFVPRELKTTKAEYDQYCDSVSGSVSVAKGPSSLLDAINSARSEHDKRFVERILRNEKVDYTEYGTSLAPYLAPFVVLFVLTFIGFWFCCGCVCCRCCRTKCCRCCRRQYDQKPYSSCEMCWPVIFYFVVAAGAIACCVFGIVAAAGLMDSVPHTQCSVSLIFTNLLFNSSDTTVKWQGTGHVITRLQEISDGVGNIRSDIQAAFAGQDFQQAQTDFNNHLDTIDGDFDQTSEQEVSGLVDSSKIIVPFFTRVGPKTNDQTMTGKLKSGFDTFIGNVLNILDSLKSAANTVESSTTTIQTELNSAKTDVEDIDSNFHSFGQSYLDANDTIDPYLEIIRLSFLILYIVTIVFVSLGIIGVIFVKACNMSCCRFLNHLGWCFTAWLVMLSLLLGVMLWAVGLTLSDSCYALQILVTPTELRNIYEIRKSAQYVEACLNIEANPSMADTLNVRKQVDDIDKVNTEMDKYESENYQGNLSVNSFTELTDLVQQLDDYLARPNSLITTAAGVDSSKSWDQAVSNVEQAIQSNCVSGDDKFVGNSADCPSGYTQGGVLGSKTCIVVGTTDYSSRYLGCTGSVQTDANKLLTTYTEVKNKLSTLKSKIDDSNNLNDQDVRDKVNAAVNKANDFQNIKWNNFRNSVNSTIQLVSHPESGLISQLECKWIGQRWQALDKALCDSTVPNLAIIGMSLVLASSFNIFVVICGGCIAIRLKGGIKKKKSDKQLTSGVPDLHLEGAQYSRAKQYSVEGLG